MINGVGNLISFSDNNISSNSVENYSNYSNDSSFAEMLNKLQNADIYSESSTNRSVNREDYNDYSKDDFKKYLETMENDKIANYHNDEIDNSEIKNDIENQKSENNFENEKIENKENNIDNKNIESQESENALENKKIENEENHIEKSENKNHSDKLNINSTADNKKLEHIKSIKEKVKNIIENNNLFVKNTKSEKLSSMSLNMTEEEKENLIKEIDNLKKEIKNLQSQELSDKEKEDLNILFESLESVKNIFNETPKEKSDNIKDLQIKNTEEKNLKELKETLKDGDINKNIEIKDNSAETKDNFILENASKNNKELNKSENKIDNLNSNLNNTISEDKGGELTIINMKDSPEGANLKGFNHYNNVSKTQSGNNLTESMIKFQDLMGKLVEKAQVALNNGKSEVLMSLNPEYLGKVRLKISMDGDNFVGKIFVDNAEIKDIFTKNLDTVITSLNEIGVNIEGFDVMLRQDMPNEEFPEFSDFANNNAFGNNGGDFAEEVVADIKNYIIPERKLNLLI